MNIIPTCGNIIPIYCEDYSHSNQFKTLTNTSKVRCTPFFSFLYTHFSTYFYIYLLNIQQWGLFANILLYFNMIFEKSALLLLQFPKKFTLLFLETFLPFCTFYRNFNIASNINKILYFKVLKFVFPYYYYSTFYFLILAKLLLNIKI